MFDMTDVSPEFMAELEERSKKFGFSSVQDYLIHLILVDKKFDTKKGKVKVKVKKKGVAQSYTESKPSDAVKIVSWNGVKNFLTSNHTIFEKVEINANGTETKFDNKFNTGDTKPDGVNKKDLNLALCKINIMDTRVHITAQLAEGRITFMCGVGDSEFSAVGTTKDAVVILRDWFEEDSEG